MLDDIVVIPLELSNNDLLIILEVAKKMGVSRNEAIRILIRRGFESLVSEHKPGKGGGKK